MDNNEKNILIDCLNENEELRLKIKELQLKLEESEEIIRAIQNGDIDAVVINSEIGEQVYTLSGADYAYRELVENMNEAAVTIAIDHSIIYCNNRFAQILKTPAESITGKFIKQFIYGDDLPLFFSIINKALIEKNNV
jgi:formate hydrogenlyase transcriptional activator